MLTAQRKQRILERLAGEGQVSVAVLSHEWSVSEDTVRRDLRDLAEEGLLQRVHGGALPASPALGDYAHREGLSTEIKARLGRAAAALIRPSQVIAFDGGTSNLEIVRALPAELTCTVVTHSPLIAAELRRCPKVEILLVGGRIFRHSQVAVGSEAAQAAARIRTDVFFLGATGLHHELGATTGDWEEAAIKRVFCHNAAETVLLVSPEKWGAASTYQIVPAEQLTTLVVESATEPSQLSPFLSLGLTIVRA